MAKQTQDIPLNSFPLVFYKRVMCVEQGVVKREHNFQKEEVLLWKAVLRYQ